MSEQVIAGIDPARPGSDKTVLMLARNNGKELMLANLRAILEPYRIDQYGFLEVGPVPQSEPLPMMPEEAEEWIPNNRKGRRHQAALQRRR